jgi:hypothetical protein
MDHIIEHEGQLVPDLSAVTSSSSGPSAGPSAGAGDAEDDEDAEAIRAVYGPGGSGGAGAEAKVCFCNRKSSHISSAGVLSFW